jgi:predicted DNA-binding transcriptional regulator AlpA
MSNQEKTADTITLLSLKQVCDAIGFSSWTVEGWVREGKFPRPLVAGPGSPRRWKFIDIESWIAKRARARVPKASPRGKLRRGAL